MKPTAVVITTLVVFAGLYDAFAVTFLGGVDTSVSRFLQESSQNMPIFYGMIWAVFGHVFMYMPRRVTVQQAARVIVAQMIKLGKDQWAFHLDELKVSKKNLGDWKINVRIEQKQNEANKDGDR